MSQKNTHDLIVIGAGSGGLSTGITLRRLGLSVLLVDKTDRHIGGDCLNTGCVPSKAILHVSHLLHQARQAGRFGVEVGGKVDFEAVKGYIREKQDIIRAHENAAWLREKEGMDVVLGTARFTGRTEVEVDGRRYRAKNIVLATGSVPRRLSVPGAEHVDFQTHETIFDLPQLPARLLVIGAGPIGVEMGQAFARLGSTVTVVGGSPQILENELPEISGILRQRLAGEGVAFKLDTQVTAFPDAHTARLQQAGGAAETLPFDAVLLAIGRAFRWDDLHLPAAGIETENGKLKLDGLRTTNPHVYAVGDAVGGPYFSHAAELHAAVLARQLLAPGWLSRLAGRLSYDHFSWVTFTDPEVATFGLGQAELERRKLRYRKLVYDLAADDRATVADYRYGRLVLFVRPGRFNPLGARLLGGSLIAPAAGEVIQELILARQRGIPVGGLFAKTYPYPTASRINKLVLVDTYAENLPGWVKKLVRRLYGRRPV